MWSVEGVAAMACLGRTKSAPAWKDWVPVEGGRAGTQSLGSVVSVGWEEPQAARTGYSTPQVFPREAGEARPAGSDRPCASRQAICPSPAPGTHPQDQLSLLQFKGRESFLSLGCARFWGKSGGGGYPGVSLVWTYAMPVRLSILEPGPGQRMGVPDYRKSLAPILYV